MHKVWLLCGTMKLAMKMTDNMPLRRIVGTVSMVPMKIHPLRTMALGVEAV
jgi:hypothetical protein